MSPDSPEQKEIQRLKEELEEEQNQRRDITAQLIDKEDQLSNLKIDVDFVTSELD